MELSLKKERKVSATRNTLVSIIYMYPRMRCVLVRDTDMEIQNIFGHLATVSGEHIYVATGYPMILQTRLPQYVQYITIVASNILNTDVTCKSGVRRLHVQCPGKPASSFFKLHKSSMCLCRRFQERGNKTC